MRVILKASRGFTFQAWTILVDRKNTTAPDLRERLPM